MGGVINWGDFRIRYPGAEVFKQFGTHKGVRICTPTLVYLERCTAALANPYGSHPRDMKPSA